MHKIKRWLGIEKYSPFISNYFEKAIFKAGINMAIIVILLEAYVIWSVTMNVLTSGKPRTISWIISHYASYVTLLVSGTIVLVYSISYLWGKAKNRRLGYGLIIYFCSICVAFGIYISSMDYAKGEQILTFLSMEIFVFCLFVWRPIVSFLLLTLTFLVFLFVINRQIPLSFATELNMVTFWVSALLVSISSYRQYMEDAKSSEALKNAFDDLELTAITDGLTGLANYSHFISHAKEILLADKEHVPDYMFLFLNIVDFKAYNQKHGYEKGDALLLETGQRLKNAFSQDFVARVSDDHFILLVKDPDIAPSETNPDGAAYRADSAEGVLAKLDAEFQKEHPRSRLSLVAGAYRPKDCDCDIARACDYARYACSTLEKQVVKRFAIYDEKMDEVFHRKQYIINHLEEAIEKGYIQPYYQPVVLSEDFTLCGVEALARWIDPVYGFLSPGAFIPVLEEYNQIHKLDICIMENVCKDLRRLMDEGKPAIPASINFSRLDFENADIFHELEKTVQKY
ncbi:MAG: EAL domain-containing protein, partial [Lachnospiraceae bacterium]|nr:EAL domain-containing protein [Lachnospiraceae bacterium]